MRIRRWVMSGMLALALSLPAAAAEYVIDANEPQAGNTYPTLDELNSADVLRPGDTIILHNNDFSLTQALDWDSLTIRSAPNSPDIDGDGEGDGWTVGSGGSVAARNTQFLDTARVIIQSPLDVTFDSRAPVISRWDGELIVMDDDGQPGSNDVNINLAPGKFWDVDYLEAMLSGVTITGGGTLVTGGGMAGTLTIDNGRVHFTGENHWNSSGYDISGKPIPYEGGIHIGANGVFKPTLYYDPVADGFRTAYFGADSFTSDQGARFEIGNISMLPPVSDALPPAALALIDIADDDVEAVIAPSLRAIDNSLMAARFEENGLGSNDLRLVITKVNDLDTLNGVGAYADLYRHSELSYLERDMLDSIYARGGTESDKGFLQTVGGVIIQNSLLAVRGHNENIVNQINRRLTSYQDEELENIPTDLDDLEGVTSESLGDCYDDCGDDGENFYNETWAFLDHGRSSQEDDGDVAAYAMNTTTLGIGHDWHRDQWIYGGMLSYATGAMKLSNQGATKNAYDFLTAAAYISWAEDGWYLSGTGAATYGWNSAHSAYALHGITLGSDADFTTSALGLNIEAGHMLETEFYGIPLRVTPYGSLSYTRMSRDSVSDTGARDAALDIDLRKHFRAADWNTWDAALGFRLAVPMRVNDTTIVPSVDLSYARTNGERTPDGGLVSMYNNPANTWDLGLMDSNRAALRMAAAVQAEIREDITLGATYEFEWRKQYWNNRFNVNVSMDF